MSRVLDTENLKTRDRSRLRRTGFVKRTGSHVDFKVTNCVEKSRIPIKLEILRGPFYIY